MPRSHRAAARSSHRRARRAVSRSRGRGLTRCLCRRARNDRTHARAGRSLKPGPPSTTCSSPPPVMIVAAPWVESRRSRSREGCREPVRRARLPRRRGRRHRSQTGECPARRERAPRAPGAAPTTSREVELAGRRGRYPPWRVRGVRPRASPAARPLRVRRSASPFSSRNRSAVSGVRSSCDASETNCSCAVTVPRASPQSGSTRRPVAGSRAGHAPRSPAPSTLRRLPVLPIDSRRRNGRENDRASRRPTAAAAARTISPTPPSATR